MTNKRWEYIDALRGFTMFLVVFLHISTAWRGGEIDLYDTVLGSICIAFRMPLFFFISGFIAYKSSEFWSFDFYIRRFRHKAAVQLIPPLVFFVLYALCFGGEPLGFLRDGFGKFWFTPVLFEMFALYFTASVLLRNRPKTLDALLIALAACGVVLAMGSPLVRTRVGTVLYLENLFKYFQFFVLGILARKYKDRFFALVSDSRFNAALLAVFVGSLCALLSFDLLETCPFLGKTARHLLVRYAGLLTVFALFYRHRDFFAAGGTISRAMQFVGRRTLDIYLLHYFLIHHSPSGGVFEWIATGPAVLCIFVVGLYALLVIGLCLLLSETLRNSPLLARCLFGVPRRSETPR